jgi:hypothetical protein
VNVELDSPSCATNLWLLAANFGTLGYSSPDAVPSDRLIAQGKVRTFPCIHKTAGCLFRIVLALILSQSGYAQTIIEKPLYGLMKLSALFFYRRIFTTHRHFLTFNSVMIALVTTWTAAFLIVDVFLCGTTPWVLWTPGAVHTCVNRNNLNLLFSITDAVGDILIVSMPFPVISKLQIDRRQKIAVALIFLLGALSTACSIIRLGTIVAAVTGADTGAPNVPGTAAAVWSTIEGAIGVLAACLPPLGPLILRGPSLIKASRQFYHKLVSRRTSGQELQGSWSNPVDTRHESVPKPIESRNASTSNTVIELDDSMRNSADLRNACLSGDSEKWLQQ